jgi:hypothetical protein
MNRIQAQPSRLRLSRMPDLCHVANTVALEVHDIDVVRLCGFPVGGRGPLQPVWVPANTAYAMTLLCSSSAANDFSS